ncbi:MAG: SRPBCC domain-containing protein [Saprospiraceae bacterium]|nr:SRPBCC domain-containing protein [Saprospiraceae bacterium]
MPDILHAFYIQAPLETVFQAVSQAPGLDKWWTQSCRGTPGPEEEYEFFFTPEYIWKGSIRIYNPPHHIEFLMTDAQEDWMHTIVSLQLRSVNNGTEIEFAHRDWKEANKHFRVSSYCWATYLRVLKLYLEKGAETPYELWDLV